MSTMTQKNHIPWCVKSHHSTRQVRNGPKPWQPLRGRLSASQGDRRGFPNHDGWEYYGYSCKGYMIWIEYDGYDGYFMGYEWDYMIWSLAMPWSNIVLGAVIRPIGINIHIVRIPKNGAVNICFDHGRYGRKQRQGTPGNHVCLNWWMFQLLLKLSNVVNPMPHICNFGRLIPLFLACHWGVTTLLVNPPV